MHFSRSIFSILSLSLLPTLHAQTIDHTKRPDTPNVILIVVDDLGWQDLECYDIDDESPMETPSMNALAGDGVMFWQGYSAAPTNAASRHAIISGIHPARAQKTLAQGGTPPAPETKDSRMISPWSSARMPVKTLTIAEALQDRGYATAQIGKWNLSIKPDAQPQPEFHGFDLNLSNIGVSAKMDPDRLSDFATSDEGDPYQLDKNGFAKNQTNLDALQFVVDHKDLPFFLYYTPYLPNSPIQTRNKKLLEKYSKKLGVEIPESPEAWTGENNEKFKGQNNPYYCAMIEELDYYIGELVEYLFLTDDLRWTNHKLIDNTYVILTSSNGAAEIKGKEIITNNAPLNEGKASIMEGGTRVPFIIIGPDVPLGKESNVMVSGIDIYETILAWTGAKASPDQPRDGFDLSALLSVNANDSTLVSKEDGSIRDHILWHLPNKTSHTSSIRTGDYKLIQNYDDKNTETAQYELYKLYDSSKPQIESLDIGESNNIAESHPDKVKELSTLLQEQLSSMQASLPYYNPNSSAQLPNKEKIPTVVNETHEVSKEKQTVTIQYKENGAKVTEAHLLYTLNGGDKHEEWFKASMMLDGEATSASAELPEGTTHYVFNLIDENSFLVSHPGIENAQDRGDKQPSSYALKNKEIEKK